MEKETFHGLNHLRAVAILLVLLYHYRAFKHPEWVDTIGWVGWTGVDLFFVLSGFLISNQLFRELKTRQSIHLKTFFTKRFFRILPPYAFTLCLYFYIPFFREREALPPLWKFITFTQNYGLDVIHQGTFSHAWSLCIEEQFYVVLPLLLLLFIRINAFAYLKWALVLLILIPIAIRFYSWNEYLIPHLDSPDFWKEWYRNIYYPTYTRFDSLAMGVLLGYCFQFSAKFKTILQAHGNLLLLIGMVSLGFSFWFCKDEGTASVSIFGFTLVAISYGLIVMGALSNASVLGSTKSFFTSQLALLSYAIYLSHKGIIHLVQYTLDQHTIATNSNLTLLLSLAACILGGLCYRYALEKPAARIKEKILAKIR